MRKLLIILSSALLVGAVLYQILGRVKGYLLLSAGNYVIETSLWGAFVAVLLTVIFIYFLWRLVRILLLPRQWWQSLVGRKMARDRTHTTQGMLDYIDGNWPRAIENLSKGVKRSPAPALNYLGAASASFNLGDAENGKALLAQAQENGFADSLTVGLLRARIMLQDNDFEKALVMAEKLASEEPNHPSVLRLLSFARKGMSDWHGLEASLGDLKKTHALSSDEIAILEDEVYRAMLTEFGRRKKSGSEAEQESALEQLWDKVPKRLREQDQLMAIYIRQLQSLGLQDKAEARLRRFIKRQWSEILVESYGRLASDPSARLKIAEAWLKEHPQSPALLQALGRICVQGKLWGKARDYLEAALRINPTPALWLELGELLHVMQDTKASHECFRKGLSQVISA